MSSGGPPQVRHRAALGPRVVPAGSPTLVCMRSDIGHSSRTRPAVLGNVRGESESRARAVRVWFGSRLIASAVVAADQAAGCEAGMRRRFAGCQVTNEAVR